MDESPAVRREQKLGRRGLGLTESRHEFVDTWRIRLLEVVHID